MNVRVIHRAALLMLLAFPVVADGQVARIRALGGVTLPLHDRDFSLNPYDWGENPAWLQADEEGDWLKIIPSAGEEWGSLKRKYDPARIVRFGTAFDGRKDLFEKGAFRGSASYDVEHRRDVDRSLKRYPYAGEAFFITDTTRGNFTYNGPTVRFIYSYELVRDLSIGASIRYQIQNGLKDTYSRVKALYRDLRTSIGATLRLGGGWIAGVTVGPWDSQESMEAKSEESFEVELFSFRGETYATRQRGTAIDHKVRKRGMDVGGHLVGSPDHRLSVGILATHSSGETRVLVPRGLEKEVQEGYAPVRSWGIRSQARYDLSEEVTAGALIGYRRLREWSEHSALGLLLWDWSSEDLIAGAGIAWRPAPDLLVAVEGEFGRTSVDSLKFIDDRTLSASPTRFGVRACLELAVTPLITFRCGGEFRTAGIDLENGMPDVAGFGLTGGAGIQLAGQGVLDLFAEYRTGSPGGMPGLRRGLFGGGMTLVMIP